MCTASAKSASEPNAKPPTTSTPRNAALATSAMRSARLRLSIRRLSRVHALGAFCLSPEHLLDVLAHLGLVGRPAARAHSVGDRRRIDGPPLVRGRVDGEAELQRLDRGLGVEVGTLPREQPVD